MALLEVKNLTMNFGGLIAVNDFRLELNKHELVGLIGPNGAGKTTIFNLLTGNHDPTEGTMKLDGKSIVGKKPYDIVKLGAGRTFQNIRLFNNLSVLDNIKIAYNGSLSYSLMSGVMRLPKFWKEEQKANKACLELLAVFDLDGYAYTQASSLPYGQQRKLEIARALATKPKVLLLDEPAAGMNARETRELDAMILQLRDDEKVSILLIEHDMKLVMSLSDRIYVVDYGKKIAEGTPQEVSKNPNVIKAYLGEEVDA